MLLEENMKSLKIEDETFEQLREDMNQVLQKLLANMAEKGSTEGKLTVGIDVSFTEEKVANRDPNIPGDSIIVHTPSFSHKVGSVLQIKNEKKGDIVCDGMEMIWDDEKGEYVLRPITGQEQMNIYDMEEVNEIPEPTAALPGPTNLLPLSGDDDEDDDEDDEEDE